MTVSDPRVVVDTALGIDWQATEGEAAPSAPFSPAQFIVCRNIDRNPDPSYIQPDGTHGSIFRRFEGTRIVTQAFKKELEFFGSRHQVLPFLESVMSGQPTVAFVDLTLSGPSAGNISALSFIGLRPYHNAGVFDSVAPTPSTVFMQLTPTAGAFPVTVDFFTDAALTNQVATAVVAAAATPTAITAVGGSDLTGSITLSAAPAVVETADAVIDKIVFAFANQYTRFFRIFYTDGDEVIVLSDCVVQMLTLNSAESGELLVTAAIMAKRRDITAATALAIPSTELDLVTLAHSDLIVTKDPAGVPVTFGTDDFTFNIENDVLQYIANSPTPQKLIKRGFVGIGGTIGGEHSDEFAGLIDDARANSAVGAGFIDFRADYLLAGNTMRFDMKKTRIRLEEPNVAEEVVEKANLTYEAHFDGVTDPVAVSVEL